MSDNPAVELAARMPWTVAREGSWWEVSGQRTPTHSFTECLARVLPKFVTGTSTPVFEVLVFGDPFVVPASSITSATELLFVYADHPRAAYYEADQEIIDRS